MVLATAVACSCVLRQSKEMATLFASSDKKVRARRRARAKTQTIVSIGTSSVLVHLCFTM